MDANQMKQPGGRVTKSWKVGEHRDSVPGKSLDIFCGQQRIATVYDLSQREPYMGMPATLEESQAVARLIAAAPDLLAALRAIAEDSYTEPNYARVTARAAILRAEAR